MACPYDCNDIDAQGRCEHFRFSDERNLSPSSPVKKPTKITNHALIQFVKRYLPSAGIDLKNNRQRHQVDQEIRRILKNSSKNPLEVPNEFLLVNSVERISFIMQETETEERIITCLAKTKVANERS